jgi:CRISPR-associated exonuclease Cas4
VLKSLLDFDISGVEFQYYFVCPTQLWLFSHNIIKSNEDENVKIGKRMHEEGYKREKKEKQLARSKFDIVKISTGYIVYERKKQRILESNINQLKFYLFVLSQVTNSKVNGVLIAPSKRIPVQLNEHDYKFIENAINEIRRIKSLKSPPLIVKKPICKRCGYRNFCFSGEYDR